MFLMCGDGDFGQVVSDDEIIFSTAEGRECMTGCSDTDMFGMFGCLANNALTVVDCTRMEDFFGS